MGKARRILRLLIGLLKKAHRDPRSLFGLLESALGPQIKQIKLEPAIYLRRIAPLAESLNLVVDPQLSSRPTLNVLLPGLTVQSMSGGPNTALHLAVRLALTGVPIRLISCNVPGGDSAEIRQHLCSLAGLNGLPPQVTFADNTNLKAPPIIGENDVFLATAWWTAYGVRHALSLTRPKQFIYLIQDYEPSIWPLSTTYALALETYSLNYLAVINSRLLAEYFSQARIGRFAEPGFLEKCAVFDPAVDSEKFYPERREASDSHRMLIYARPETGPRNLFELGVYALNQAALAGAFATGDWEVSFIGEQVPSLRLDTGLLVKSLPWTDHDSNAKLLRSADLVMSLILSSHPSYVPLEAAACGAVVVTNDFLNKTPERLRALSPNFVVASPTEQGIVSAIREATRRVVAGEVERENPVRLPRDWSLALAETVPRVREIFEQCVASGSGRVA